MREASTDHLAIASSSVLGLKIAILDKIVIFSPNIELEAIARQSVDASREVDCAYFGNIDRNSGYFLLPIFLGSYLNEQLLGKEAIVPEELSKLQQKKRKQSMMG